MAASSTFQSTSALAGEAAIVAVEAALEGLGLQPVTTLNNLRHDIDPETGLPYSGGIQTDPTRRLDRRWGFPSNELLVKVQYAFRY